MTKRIDGDRLLGDLYALRKIGEYKTGVHRPTYSPEDVQSRHWLAARMTEAGLEPEIDGIGNVIGRSRGGGAKLLLGSHVETQPHAGWLDGALGVIYGLEVARTLGGGIDVAAWADEEGHFGSFIGSRSFCGLLPEAEIDTCHNRDGTTLRDALAQAGFAGRPRAEVDPARYRGYLEAHIEQGAELEDTGKRIGIVTAIVGSHRFRIVFEGVQNHAGTTRMAIRKDAGVALVQACVGDLSSGFPKWRGRARCGRRGGSRWIPARQASCRAVRRCCSSSATPIQRCWRRLESELEALVAEATRGPCTVTIAERGRSVPQVMDAGFQDALERAAERHAPGLHVRMPSGAGHDAQVLAERMKSAMLFVPSIGGISHHYAENTKDEDIVLGCQVFADAAAEIMASR